MKNRRAEPCAGCKQNVPVGAGTLTSGPCRGRGAAGRRGEAWRVWCKTCRPEVPVSIDVIPHMKGAALTPDGWLDDKFQAYKDATAAGRYEAATKATIVSLADLPGVLAKLQDAGLAAKVDQKVVAALDRGVEAL